MTLSATTCPTCCRTVYLARNASGNPRTLELLEHTFRIDGDKIAPCVGVYVDHAPRCPGDYFSGPTAWVGP